MLAGAYRKVEVRCFAAAKFHFYASTMQCQNSKANTILKHTLLAVVNHGVSEELVAEVFKQNRACFALPAEQKRFILADCNNRHVPSPS